MSGWGSHGGVLLQRDDDHSFKGVSRQRWSVQWQASIPKADKAVS